MAKAAAPQRSIQISDTAEHNTPIKLKEYAMVQLFTASDCQVGVFSGVSRGGCASHPDGRRGRQAVGTVPR